MYTMGNIFFPEDDYEEYGGPPTIVNAPSNNNRTVVRKKGKQQRVIVRKGDGVPVIAQPPISGNTHEQPIRF